VGGAICLVNSDNERDSSLLDRWCVSRISVRVGISPVTDGRTSTFDDSGRGLQPPTAADI